jgi:hypothetical protein
MTKLTFSQFLHPASKFPNIVNLRGNGEPMLDLYTMAGVILYTACANNNAKARENALSTSAKNARMADVQQLFEQCKKGDRTAILKMITLIVSGMETRVQKLETV